MSFKLLYAHVQTLTTKINRNHLRDKVIDLAGRGPVRTLKTTLDTEKCRGFYLSARNLTHRMVQQHGANLIVLARGLNYCWERIVYVKELMHLFDDPDEAADTGAKFESLLSELNTGSSKPSKALEVDHFTGVGKVIGPTLD
jgi:hypothetical protein